MPTAAARAEVRPESRWRTPGSKHRAAGARSRAPRSPAALRPDDATAPPHRQAPAQRTRARRRGSARASAPRSRRPAPAGAAAGACPRARVGRPASDLSLARSEEHTSELQSRPHLVCRLLLEKKKKKPLNTIFLKKKKRKDCS